MADAPEVPKLPLRALLVIIAALSGLFGLVILWVRFDSLFADRRSSILQALVAAQAATWVTGAWYLLGATTAQYELFNKIEKAGLPPRRAGLDAGFLWLLVFSVTVGAFAVLQR